MGFAANILNNIVPISDFTRGKASLAFEKVRNGAPVIVVKNNVPAAVMITPEEYDRLSEDSENLYLTQLALTRLARNENAASLSHKQVLSDLGISQEEIDALPDVEFE